MAARSQGCASSPQTSGRKMVILLDADVIIRGEKGAFDLRAWLASRADDRFEIAAITVAELWHGVERAVGPQRSKRRKYLETIVAALPIIPYTEQTAYEHARIWAELQIVRQNDRRLRLDRGGHRVAAWQPCGHVQQAPLRTGQGAPRDRATMSKVGWK